MTIQEEIYSASFDAIVALIETLREENMQLKTLVESQNAEISSLKELIENLKAQLSKNSQNSSKPPSSDGFRRPAPKSLRTRSGKASGGQTGHTGSTLAFNENPTEIKTYPADVCKKCGHSLAEIDALIHERRQVFELPRIELTVTEHRADVKACPVCHSETKGEFPPEVTQALQYDDNLKAWLVYLSQYHLLPYERVTEILSTP